MIKIITFTLLVNGVGFDKRITNSCACVSLAGMGYSCSISKVPNASDQDKMVVVLDSLRRPIKTEAKFICHQPAED